MSDQNRVHALAESVSALVDNQASELELQRILKASEHDPEVAATWLRYQAIGAVLRGEKSLRRPLNAGDGEDGGMPVFAPASFAASVSAAIAAEARPQSVPMKQGLWYQLGRAALVASVAGGMILGVQQFNGSQSFETEVAAGSTAIPAAPAVSLPSRINPQAINTRTVAMQTGYESRPQENRRVMFKPHPATAAASAPVADEEVTRYVNQMIQAHSDNAVMNSNQGILPYARVIVTEEE